MNLVSFDALRTLKLPGTTYIKPEHFFQQLPLIKAADWVLFPQHWQVNALVYSLRQRIFPSQASYLLGHDKIEMTRAFLAVAPEHVPETLIEANDTAGAERVWAQLPRPFVAKIPRSSMGEGVFLIEKRDDWQRYLAQTPAIYAQEYLPIDRDLRIVYVGRRIVGAFWRLQSAHGFHNNLARGGVIERSPVPRAARELVLRLARSLDINHAGFDIAMVGRHPYVLEFNRLFGNRGLGGTRDPLPAAIMDYLRRTSDDNDPDAPSRHFTVPSLAITPTACGGLKPIREPALARPDILKPSEPCILESSPVKLVPSIVFLCVVLSACGNNESQTPAEQTGETALGPFGPPMGVRAHVVRSVQVQTRGEITGTFSGTRDQEQTGLQGLCNPATFANFMLAMPGGGDYDEVWVTNMSKHAVGTGETGEFPLDYIEVTFRTTSGDFVQRDFRGPGTLTLTTHDAEPGHRRMIGSMAGTGLQGRDDDAGKTLDVTVNFDMDSSCGVME